MNPIVFAMRHPITVLVAIVAVVLGAVLAVFRMPIDIFPDLNTPIIYVAPPYGGNQRTIVIRADPELLKAKHLSPDDVVAALASGNEITPSGNVTINGQSPIVPVNSVVGLQIKDLEKIPIRLGTDPTVYVG